MGDAPAKARPNKAVEPTAPRAACGSSTSFMARRLTAGVRLQRNAEGRHEADERRRPCGVASLGASSRSP